jgi:hypothetical protein
MAAKHRTAERPAERRTRRRVFRVWVGLTIVFALLLALVLPFIQDERLAFLAGVPVVGLELVLLALALGWLVWFVWRPRRR